MFLNYCKIAWRNIIRHKTFSAINIAGLAFSITAFILIALYIEDELSFDRYHQKADRIYRVVDDKKTPDLLLRSASSAAPVAPALKAEFPEISETVRIISAESLISYQDKLFEERNIFFSDASIFNVFSFKLRLGNPRTALQDPATIVITESMAKKYFGSTQAIGNDLSVDGKPMRITGIVDDLPKNSHFSFDFLISMATAETKGSGYDWLFTNWYSNNFYTYILLPENYNPEKLTARLGDFDRRHHEKDGSTIHHYDLEKLGSIYLHSDRDNQVGKTGSLSNLYIFSAVAVFILLIACINFINLSTARATERAKEVGVKKCAGAARGQLITQFFIESFITTGLAMLLAVCLDQILLPLFNNFSGKSISLHLFSLPHGLTVVGIFTFTGLLSGSYPALMLSGFKPVSVLKGNLNPVISGSGIRKGLVVFQFAASVVLIVCSLLVQQQLRFMQTHNLGFNPSQTLVINYEGDKQVQRGYQSIREALLRVPGVQKVTASSAIPGNPDNNSWSMNFLKKTGDTLKTELPVYLTDFNFLDQYNIPVIAGRAFSPAYQADSNTSMLINEAALKKLGFASASEAIGVTVGMYPTDAKIIGVCKDFHFESLQHSISPLVMRVIPFKFRFMSVALNTADIKSTVAGIESTWKKMAPGRPLEYSFLDEQFNRQYQSEIKFAQVIGIFTGLGIFIATLGLFGLAMFSVRQRTREIGIRKILGASAGGIMLLLSGDFIKLVVISVCIAIPVAWYFMHRWLDDFAYRVTIEWWVFALAALSALIIAFMTISIQTIKVAMENPVNSLRSE